MPDSWACRTLFLRTITFVGAAGTVPGSPELVTSMPLPLADVILFFWTTMSSLRAPMKIADAAFSSKNRVEEPGLDAVRGQAEPGAVEDRREGPVVDALVVLDQHVPLLDSPCSVPSSAKKTAAPLWPSNRFEVIRTCWAPSSE